MSETSTNTNWLDAEIAALKSKLGYNNLLPIKLEYMTVALYGWRGKLADKMSWLGLSDSLICRLGLAVRFPKPGQMSGVLDNFGIKSDDVCARIEELNKQ